MPNALHASDPNSVHPQAGKVIYVCQMDMNQLGCGRTCSQKSEPRSRASTREMSGHLPISCNSADGLNKVCQQVPSLPAHTHKEQNLNRGKETLGKHKQILEQCAPRNLRDLKDNCDKVLTPRALVKCLHDRGHFLASE